ncbi:MAG: hypothetical protein QOD55_1986 [Solirubrobacteraceae bacterium]|jgi:hypothetical protein|nr:hypothetical protein [Solirubrobacteraceae bacterium]
MTGQPRPGLETPFDRPDLDAAFDRIDDFLAVQGGGITSEAVTLLQQAVGVDAEARATIRDRVAALEDAGHGLAPGSVLLGVLVGLYASSGR